MEAKEIKELSERVDRISNLTDPIIHKIMLFLRTEDTIRMSTLSNKFLSVCRSFPIFDFDYLSIPYHYGNRRKDFFLNSVLNYLNHAMLIDTSFEEFRLRFCCFDFECSEWDTLVNKLINFVVEKKLKHLILNNCGIRSEICTLPIKTIFSAKSIRRLHLKGLKFELVDQDLILDCPLIENLSIVCCTGFKTIKVTSKTPKLKSVNLSNNALEEIDISGNCYHLKMLNLQFNICKYATSWSNVILSNSWIEKTVTNLGLYNLLVPKPLTLFSSTSIVTLDLVRVKLESQDLVLNCPLIEKLRLSSCYGFQSIKVKSGAKLKTVILEFEYKLEDIDISACVNLKKLVLMGKSITNKWVEDNISGSFHYLERLSLKSCNLLGSFGFNHQHLKKLALTGCSKLLLRIVIEAPNLILFDYSSVFELSPPFPQVTISSNSNLEAMLKSCFGRDYGDRSDDFIYVLEFSSKCKRLRIECSPKRLNFLEKAGVKRKISDFVKILCDRSDEGDVSELAPYPDTISITDINFPLDNHWLCKCWERDSLALGDYVNTRFIINQRSKEKPCQAAHYVMGMEMKNDIYLYAP